MIIIIISIIIVIIISINYGFLSTVYHQNPLRIQTAPVKF